MLRFARKDGVLSLFLSLASALSIPAFGDEPAPPTLDAKEQASLQSFATAHPECVEWSDGCAVCRRAMAVSCSTPGIACLPSDIVCKTP